MRQALTSVRKPIWKCLVVAACLFPDTALAQLASDYVPHARVIPTPEQLKEDIERSLLRLGPLRLIPIVRLADAGYDSNIAERAAGEPTVSDWVATIQAGARWILPLGSKLYLRGTAVPEYLWYKDLAARRTFIGLYQASLLALFNRMSVEASANATKSLQYPSLEIQTRNIQSVQDGFVNLEVEASTRLSLFVRAEGQRSRFSLPDESAPGLDVAAFDRDEVAARGGIRYRISPAWQISGAVEGTRTDFAVLPEQRDNQSTAYLLGVLYTQPRFYLSLSGGYRKVRPYKNSSAPPAETPTGSYFASCFLTPNVELQVYGGRRIMYGLGFGIPYSFETSNGGELNIRVFSRLVLRGYGEYGKSDSPFTDQTTNRTNLGAGFSMPLSRRTTFTAVVSRNTLATQTHRFSYSRFVTGISFGGELYR